MVCLSPVGYGVFSFSHNLQKTLVVTVEIMMKFGEHKRSVKLHEAKPSFSSFSSDLPTFQAHQKLEWTLRQITDLLF